jgi:hypothetical protein
MHQCPNCRRYSLEYNNITRTASCLYEVDCGYSEKVRDRADFSSRFPNGRSTTTEPVRSSLDGMTKETERLIF